jgi:hypothetical protein
MISHQGPISGIAALGERYVATAGYDNQVILWDAQSKRPVQRSWHDHLVNHLSFSACGQWLVTASSDFSARIWSLPELQLHAVLRGHEDDVEMAVFHPDAPRVATASRDRSVRIFDLDGRLLHRLSGHSADVIAVAWGAGESEVLSTSDDGTMIRWDAARGALLERIDLRSIARRLGRRAIFACIGIFPVIAFLGASLGFLATAIVCGVLLELLRALVQVGLIDEINGRISSEYRATANSLISFGNRLLISLGGPLVGFLAQNYGASVSFCGLLILYLAALGAVCIPMMTRWAPRGAVTDGAFALG